MHSIAPPHGGKFTIARYFYSEDTKISLPFTLRATYTIEGNFAKVLFKFEIDRSLRPKEAVDSSKAPKAPTFEQIQIKINFPTEVNDASLMSSHGTFKMVQPGESGAECGLWTMP